MTINIFVFFEQEKRKFKQHCSLRFEPAKTKKQIESVLLNTKYRKKGRPIWRGGEKWRQVAGSWLVR